MNIDLEIPTMQLRGMLLTVTLATMPLLAQAQPIEGFYISGGVGLHIPQNTGVSANPLFLGGQRTAEQNLGFEGLASFGYAVGNGARFEIEGNFNQSSLNRLTGLPIPISTSTSGSVQHYGVMANALFDMDIGSPWVYPYIGAGIGYQITKFNNIGVSLTGIPIYQSSDSKGGFAAQAIAGLSFPVVGVPGLSIAPEYRFMDIFAGEKMSGTVAGILPTTNKLHSQYIHSFLIGVRYAFNVPPPAPVAAPPVAPAARSYLVFFDWDKATLTERARGIVRDAAADAQKAAYTRIDVDGNADTSGSHAYNQGLSLRRAQAVAAELVKDGVPKTAIAITAHGDTHLLVPTGPGVREPQNRRVEIVIK